MSIVLRVKTEVLKSKANEVEHDVRALETSFNQILDTVARSRAYWTGDGGEKARHVFDDQKENTLLVIKRFREHPRELLKMANVYDEAEHSATMVNQRLDSDVIA